MGVMVEVATMTSHSKFRDESALGLLLSFVIIIFFFFSFDAIILIGGTS